MAISFYKAQEALKRCDEHDHKELSYFCRTCKKFICTSCVQSTHNGHDCDLVTSAALKCRKTTPKFCRKIRKEKLRGCQENLSIVKSNLKRRSEDLQKLEEIRTGIIHIVDRIIYEQKLQMQKPDDLQSSKTMTRDECYELQTKLEYVDKMTTSLDRNITTYSDFDVIEMEQDLFKAVGELESYHGILSTSARKLAPWKKNEEIYQKLIHEIEELIQTNVNDRVSIEELRSFKISDNPINNIAPISDTDAVVDDITGSIKLLSEEKVKAKNIELNDGFIAISKDEFIVRDYDNQVIRRVMSNGKKSIISKTKPLHPTSISKTQTEDIIVVSMMEDGDRFKLQPSSRRLVQRMTLTGNVLESYEFREDGTTRLFTVPWRTAENGNTDICVINVTSDDTGDIIALRRDGRVRFTYHGPVYSKFGPNDLACDSRRRIIVSDWNQNCLIMLSPGGTLLRYLLCHVYRPQRMAIYQGSLWIGTK